MNELRDKNGLTEAEYIARYDASKFQRPSVTVDIILIKDNKILLIRRGGHPCLGKLAFPGGFIEMNEDVYTAAARELLEETNLKACNMRMLTPFTKPDRAPQTRIITFPILTDVADETELSAGDDAQEANWYDISYTIEEDIIKINLSKDEENYSFRIQMHKDPTGFCADVQYKSIDKSPLAFDHGEILGMAIANL